MKKWFLIAAAGLLAGCGEYSFQPKADIDVQVSDAGQTATVTKSVDAQTGAVTYSTSQGTPATFVFTSKPGSQAAYINSYTVTRYVVNGEDLTTSASGKSGLNVYVPSGFTCPTASNTQSCDPTAATTSTGNGAPSQAISLDFTPGLSQRALAAQFSQNASIDLVFNGKSATGADIHIAATGIVATALFVEPGTPTTGTPGDSTGGTSTGGTSTGGTSTGGISTP